MCVCVCVCVCVCDSGAYRSTSYESITYVYYVHYADIYCSMS